MDITLGVLVVLAAATRAMRCTAADALESSAATGPLHLSASLSRHWLPTPCRCRRPALRYHGRQRRARLAVWLQGAVLAASLYGFAALFVAVTAATCRPARLRRLTRACTHAGQAPATSGGGHAHDHHSSHTNGGAWRNVGWLLVTLALLVLIGARDSHALAEVALLGCAALMVLPQRSTPRLVREAGGPWRLFALTVRAAAICSAPLAVCEWCWFGLNSPLLPSMRNGGGGDHGGDGGDWHWRLWQCLLFGVLGLFLQAQNGT